MGRRNESDTARIARLEDQVAQLLRTVSRLQASPARPMPPPLRLAVTAVDPATIDEEHEEGIYPTYGNTVFVRFVDATFTETAGGSDSLTKYDRTEEPKVVARTVSGTLPPKGSLCAVARLGKRWWILDGVSQLNLVVGTLDETLSGATAEATLEEVLIGTVPHAYSDTVTVRNVIDWENHPDYMFEGTTGRTFLALLVGDEYQLLWVACEDSS